MGKILDFHRKREAKAHKEFHNMWISQDDQWVIWRCDTCSRKLKMSKSSNELVIERRGDFFAQHSAAVELTPGS